MAIRLTAASSQYIERTSNPLNYNADYTVMYWYYRTGTATDHCMYEASAEATQSNHDDNYRITSSGACFIQVEGAGGSPSTTGSNIVQASVWSHVAMVRSGFDCTMYINGVSGATLNKDITSRTDPVVNNRIGVYYDNTLQNKMDGRVYAVKIWSAALSIAEIKAEAQQVSPIKYDSLYYWMPCNPADHIADYSANRYHWTEVSSPTDEAAPDIAWPALDAPIVVVAGTNVALESSCSWSFSATADASVTKTLESSNSWTFSATGAASVTKTLASTNSWTFSATADTSVTKTLASSNSWTFSATADLGIAKPLESASSWAFSATGDVSITKPLDAAASWSFSATNDLSLTKTLAAVGSWTWSATAALTEPQVPGNVTTTAIKLYDVATTATKLYDVQISAAA